MVSLEPYNPTQALSREEVISMEKIVSSTVGELSGIVGSIFRSIMDDLLIPTGPRTIEEQLSAMINGKDSRIISQSDQIVFQIGVIREQAWEITELKNLLTQKDKEIRLLQDRIRSLELQH